MEESDDTESARAGGDLGFFTPDRKSTRLNSSHQIISYAVFCLKKKKKSDFYAIAGGPATLAERLAESIKRTGGSVFFFFNDTATTEIYTLSLHDALPI